ncbi:MAG: hypothetical protein KAT16_01150 [Candidatus Heimdallarchaeota archaeon]|nr:hypothetical protein [Candidatus Heimdallarchaeota archaeon]
MKTTSIYSYTWLTSLLLVVLIFSFSVSNTQQSSGNQESIQDIEPVRFIYRKLPYFGGVNSISAVTSTHSSLGVLFGTPDNPFPLSFYSNIIQKQAQIEILNRRGTLVNRTELITRHTFLVKLASIIEFDIVANQSGYNTPIRPEKKKIIDLSMVNFTFTYSKVDSDGTDSILAYHLEFSATDIPYNPSTNPSLKLDSLVFSIDFWVEKSEVVMQSIPKITIRPEGTHLAITRNEPTQRIKALRFAPRLKFSCNIDGWDFSTTTSKLLLNVSFFANEEIVGLKDRIDNIELNRLVLQQSKLLSELKFTTERDTEIRDITVDQDSNQSVNYINQRFLNNQFSYGSSFRNFMNFTWVNNVNVDGETFPVVFQPLSSGRIDLALQPTVLASTLFLNGGFIFPQGNEIAYDPELQIEELNPIFNYLPAPLRTTLEASSQLILVSGFFLGVIIIFRLKSKP